MASGGAREGAGRPKGVPNKASAEFAAAVAASGETPKEYMLRVMRDATVEHERRDKMAVAVSPYVHQRLSTLEVTGKDGEALMPAADTRELSKAVMAVFNLLKSGVKPPAE